MDAAVACIAEHGYGGATTDLIAKTAGTTRGPLQYYFKDRAGLIYAAFQRLHQAVMGIYEEELRGVETPRAYVEAVLDAGYRVCRSREHYALLEILIAARSDADLQGRLAPLLAAANAEIDRTWALRFPDGASTQEQRLAVRYLLVAINRGLALNSLTFPDEELFEREYALTRAIAFQLFGLDAEPGA